MQSSLLEITLALIIGAFLQYCGVTEILVKIVQFVVYGFWVGLFNTIKATPSKIAQMFGAPPKDGDA